MIKKCFKALILPVKIYYLRTPAFHCEKFQAYRKVEFYYTINNCILNLDATLVNILLCSLYHISIYFFLDALSTKLEV